jgi:hypothetical protein
MMNDSHLSGGAVVPPVDQAYPVLITSDRRNELGGVSGRGGVAEP